MKVGTKLAIGFSLVILFMMTTVIFCLNGSRNMYRDYRFLREAVVPAAITMAVIDNTSQQITHNLMEYIVTAGSEQEYQKEMIIAGLSELERAGDKHLEYEHRTGSESKSQAEELIAKIEGFTSACMGIIDLKKQGLSTEALLEKEKETVHPALKALTEQIEQMYKV